MPWTPTWSWYLCAPATKKAQTLSTETSDEQTLQPLSKNIRLPLDGFRFQQTREKSIVRLKYQNQSQIMFFLSQESNSLALAYRGSHGAMTPDHHREVFQRTLFYNLSELLWNPFIIYLRKTAIKQSHSIIYAAFVDLPICLRRVVTICFRQRVYITNFSYLGPSVHTHMLNIYANTRICSRPIIYTC